MGPDYAVYFASGGTQGTKPDDPNILKMWDLFSEAASLKADGRNKNAQEIWKILADQQIGIGTVGQSPAGLGVRLVSNRLGQHRVPRLQRAALPHAGQLASGDLVLQDLTLPSSCRRRPASTTCLRGAAAATDDRARPGHDGLAMLPT